MHIAPTTPSPLMSSTEVGAYLHVTSETVRRWTREGIFVAPIQVGRTIKFRRTEVAAWCRTTGSEIAASAMAITKAEQAAVQALVDAGFSEIDARRIVASRHTSPITIETRTN